MNERTRARETRRWNVRALGFAVAATSLGAVACSTDGGEAKSGAGPVVTAGGAAGAAGAAGGSAGKGGAGAGTSVGGGSGSGGGAGSGTGGASAAEGGTAAAGGCPAGLPGPELVEIREDGWAFCIDAHEVTQAQYAEFVGAMQGKGMAGECSWRVIGAPCTSPEDLDRTECMHDAECVTHFDPRGTPERRMECVSWCDARAYCEWAGKRLCSGLPGTKVPLAARFERPPRTEWQFACTQGGRTVYPYGDLYESGRCLDASVDRATLGIDFSSGWPSCRGARAPYDRLQDMVGSLSEWTADCEGSDCALEGGHFAMEAPSCASGGHTGYGSFGVSRGIRCCSDPGGG